MNENNIQTINRMSDDETDIRALIIFLNEINASFPVSLSEKIQIDEYAKKVLRLGLVMKMEQNNEIIGIITGYVNDTVTGNGYISVLGVSEHHRGKKIGSRLLQSFIDQARIEGMKKLSLFTHKDNQNALNMYLNHGFSPDDSISKNYSYDIALTLNLTT
ncbi:GNAT family N-acetyltransferase [Trichococcus alkaliphilus]|uniref:GNAT family N-acetyltransferase n=1 Tax=Trichococcus alkaliphilus TaxID=2052943 RepID=UPI000D0BD6C4|nr:GNAT family N-acetyltransferase [Trichococcus alkaliphilus]